MEIMPEAPQQQKPSRGIYLLPNLFTTAALFSGFYAVLAAMGGKFEHAAVAIFVAMVMDGLDGRVARLTNTQTAFGAEYDSLSDMVAFGLAPSLVMYVWSLNHLGKLGWLAAFIYTAGAALRLARFNTQVGTADKRYFQGLPSPAAAAILAGSVWVAVEYQIAGADVSLLVCFITLASGLLMVSNVRYNSFKEIDFKGKIPFVSVVVMMLVLAVVISQPPTVLFIIFMAYAISGPVLTLRNLQQRRAERRTAQKVSDEDHSAE
ncbi:MAG: CDP-diacylglycerol--serine O-phosphatidyltransferase [Sedimenticola sp.]|uniref:CDP-diacylglycerol--serine O-phosphatidyltransferase n=1 Tax=Sedimenticola thiotaurini TaxID=1543721 RepID=A0A558D9J4_9GAMM|nr:CDP-diacylglycerol--serine O-phosphatidyltransferase [Sedimenticola sp.]MCW8920271.1 CDP-diacylglycerol--serine O-phosphatidyltransferase [Sedimenticola sp.]MCW8950338.1 CDP-diacylglycerol--serine O-phosphatidyltransferase [Sedimenticola sp.]TVT57636.1 MAG: CDP-diacylglycerol--serine O-phosphatidyltransferase [Sedimenticola thiotaurini]